ncbi:ferrochelatase [Phaeocystidibacter luteus]|uniref:Ferrochelatase n=1 Tax=Phaeocystidibacter luteus TaxID=911197 RepID=A0A6N6RFF9_9FLAO|nr:ferrochelatase [Phaeocystidibacter luteus]KAB2807069.1 ferrochelatase [Phaeocystidibacter luteus]
MKSVAMLVNLGSPDSTEVKDVKRYLGEFLMDGRVIDVPYLLRAFLVKGIILNTRPKKSAEAYKSIWWENGSPLIVLSERLQEKVQAHSEVKVELAMRYGNPSITETLKRIKSENPDLENLFVIPLYPHYAMSSYETVVERVREVAESEMPGINLDFQEPFYDDDQYIDILAKSIKPALETPFTKVLFSYHGVPERHIKKGDVTGNHCLKEGCCQTKSPAHAKCYRHQCFETTRLVAEKLGLKEDQFSVSFQSRLGRDPWLTPFTDATLKEYGHQGMERLVVVCPAFVSDCLETLEEIQVEGVHDFLGAGGKAIEVVPCLNDREDWSALLGKWIDNRTTV